MSCFLKHKGEIYITNAEKIDEISYIFQFCKNAFLEKTEFYWRIIPIHNMKNKPLTKERHYLIKDGLLYDNFCSPCKDRIRSLHSLCNHCSFFPIPDKTEKEELNIQKITQFLKEKGLYEVDKFHFNKELTNLKRNKIKNKTG